MSIIDWQFSTKINNYFTLLLNLETWQPFVHLFEKCLALSMLTHYKKPLVYQQIFNVSKKNGK